MVESKRKSGCAMSKTLSVSLISQFLFIPASLLGVAASALAQGTVVFNNYVPAQGIFAAIFAQTLGKGKLEGTNYYAQLFGGPEGSPEAALQALGTPVTFGTGATAGYVDVKKQ